MFRKMSYDRTWIIEFLATFLIVVYHLPGEILTFKNKLLQEFCLPIEKAIFLKTVYSNERTFYRNSNFDISQTPIKIQNSIENILSPLEKPPL